MRQGESPASFGYELVNANSNMIQTYYVRIKLALANWRMIQTYDV